MQNYSEKVELKCNEKFGRHLIAAVDIETGDMILEEKALLIAPHWECDQMKCSNCFEDSFIMCKKCQVFPLCIDCNEHSEFDCEYFRDDTKGGKLSKNILVKNYAIYATLKLLLLMENPKTSSDCNIMLSKCINLNDYRNSQMWQEHEEHVVKPLMQSGIVQTFKRVEVDAERLHELCILADAHAFEVISREGGDSLKGVYVFGARLPHSCIPNTVIAIDDDFKMKIYAALPIKRGALIYNSYANPLMGTSQRQHYLHMMRHIDCKCTRCLDPTELGTHMSSLKCQSCTDGYVVHQSDKANWICRKCNTLMDNTAVHKLLATLSEEMLTAEGDLEIYKNLLAKYKPHLHPNHFLLIDIKQNIAAILRATLIMHSSFGNSDSDSNKAILERKVQLCEEILPVMRAIQPGISKLYAITLFEYLTPFTELIEMQFKNEEITKESYVLKLKMAKEIATKAADMLAFEPSNSPEGHLVQRITMEQKHIEENLKKLL